MTCLYFWVPTLGQAVQEVMGGPSLPWLTFRWETTDGWDQPVRE